MAVVTCEECGKKFYQLPLRDVMRNERGEEIDICPDCFTNLIESGDFIECDFCHEYFPSYAVEDVGTVYIEHACESCIKKMHLAQCVACDEWFHSSEIGENGFCKNCAESNCADW